MTEDKRNRSDVKWLSLKEAARLLGCSVKTIRRRVESGKMKSIVEYQGQKAIRLVDESDVMKESKLSLRDIPLRIQGDIAPLLKDIPVYLGHIIDRSQAILDRKVDTVYHRMRVFFLVSIGVVAILIVAAYLIHMTGQSRLIRQSIVNTKTELSTIVDHNALTATLQSRRAAMRTEAARALAEASLLEVEQANAGVKSLQGYIAHLQGEIESLRRQLQKENEEREAQLGDLRTEIGTLKNAPAVNHTEGITEKGEDKDTGDSEEKSRFLGIF